MNNLEFYMLEKEIEEKMEELSGLQKEYKKVTGGKFIYGQVIDPPKFCDTCRACQHDATSWICNDPESEFYEHRVTIYGCGEHDEEGGVK